jgi:SET domain-containing protein
MPNPKKTKQDSLLAQVIIPATMIEMRTIGPPKGRGIFARCDIPKYTHIERCPVIVMPSADYAHIALTRLNNYLFCMNDRRLTGLVLGYGSLYNHSYNPNAWYVQGPHHVWDFYARRDIPKDTEITVNYNASPRGKGKMWFSVVESNGRVDHAETTTLDQKKTQPRRRKT